MVVPGVGVRNSAQQNLLELLHLPFCNGLAPPPSIPRRSCLWRRRDEMWISPLGFVTRHRRLLSGTDGRQGGFQRVKISGTERCAKCHASPRCQRSMKGAWHCPLPHFDQAALRSARLKPVTSRAATTSAGSSPDASRQSIQPLLASLRSLGLAYPCASSRCCFRPER